MTQKILPQSGHDGLPQAFPRSEPEEVPLHHVYGKTYVEIGQINTTAAIPIEEFLKNTEKTMEKAKYKRLQSLPFFGEAKLRPIALVGGGPSLKGKDIQNELKRFYAANVSVACGSSHDWMVENGILPNYCVVCDPDPISANYLKHHSNYTKYLIASSCDESVFELLKDEDVYIWHNWSDETGYLEKLEALDPNYTFAIAGGCTVGLRSLTIALMMGYSKVHFFGFDSCLGKDDARYSYLLSSDAELMGNIHTIRVGVGAPSDKVFRCEGYHLAQAAHFKQFYRDYSDYFTPVIHGEGLMKEVLELAHMEAQRIETESLGA